MIQSIPASTLTRGRRAKIIAPPKVKAVSGIISHHGILSQITAADVKTKKKAHLRLQNSPLGGEEMPRGMYQRITKAKRKYANVPPMKNNSILVIEIIWIVTSVLCVGAGIQLVMTTGGNKIFIFASMAIISFVFAWLRHKQRKKG